HLALDTTRNHPRLHPTTAWYRRTVMHSPRRWPRRLLSNQSLLAQHTDSTLPCPCPTRGPSTHHHPSTHRRRQSHLRPSADTDQDHHTRPSTGVDAASA